MKRLFSALLVLLSNSVFAQPPSEDYTLTWYDGEMVFKVGDTVACTLRYLNTATTSLLQVKHGEEIITVTADEIKSFQFYDYQNARWRRFVSMVVDSTSLRPIFLQAIYVNPSLAILSHRTVDHRYEYMRYTALISRPARMSKKYIWHLHSKQLLPLSKENALELVADKKPEIEAYIKTHHLRFKQTQDYISLFKYHDTL